MGKPVEESVPKPNGGSIRVKASVVKASIYEHQHLPLRTVGFRSYSYGATPGVFAVVLCDRSSHSVVTESCLVLLLDRLNPGGESTALHWYCLSIAI